ncbi:transcription factor-related family protein [Striga asiatica]|uniref:Transcription factor-related family protein n=1 Tax=Striga asiatica TaxID=4170 RepID=A0A5A7RIE8_STRAF|nr:transcription factor-related family protein [Striga asiatica]
MGYLLKEALRALCGVNQWSYAVFWKMDCQNLMHLIWEECYYEVASSLGSLQGFSRNGNPEINFSDYGNSSVAFESLNLGHGVPARDKVHFLMNKMMADGNVRVVGEGLIGRVVLTGNYQWMLSENYYGESQSLEVLEEALQQFSAGMKTVAVIPVLPHGVVQFGSHVTIPENIGFVKDVMSLILELGQIPGLLQSENREPKELVRGLFPLRSNTISTSSYSAASFNSAECSAQTSHAFNNGQTSFQTSNFVVGQSFEPCEPKIPAPHLTSPNQFININRVPKISNEWTNLQSFSSRMSLPDKRSAHSCFKDPIFSKVSTSHDATDQSGDDLFDVLGADFKKRMCNSSLNGRTGNEPSKISFPDILCPLIPVKMENEDLSFTGTDLLDAVVSKGQPNRSSDGSVSCVSTQTSISNSSASKVLLPEGRLGNFNHGEQNYAAKGKEVSSMGSCVFDPWAEKGFGLKPNESSVATGFSTKPNETSKPSRKRPKPGENPRPRPRDRQMIQDRVKELREIVPNGAKIISKDGDSLMKDNSGGATWAYEIGSRSMVCPIIVEDISHQPHQMVVEMLCEERGLFLEVAGTVRGLGLTILKGLMENRDGKVWACFTVEANRNVTRMETFLSLVSLLDQNAKPGFSKPNSKPENVMAQEHHQRIFVIIAFEVQIPIFVRRAHIASSPACSYVV